jgi:hypothetical protein
MMYRAAVLIPFHRRETDTDQVPGDEILLTGEELARIRAVNVNMVLVLGEVEEQAEAVEAEPAVEEQAEAPKPKKKTKKQ